QPGGWFRTDGYLRRGSLGACLLRASLWLAGGGVRSALRTVDDTVRGIRGVTDSLSGRSVQSPWSIGCTSADTVCDGDKGCSTVRIGSYGRESFLNSCAAGGRQSAECGGSGLWAGYSAGAGAPPTARTDACVGVAHSESRCAGSGTNVDRRFHRL